MAYLLLITFLLLPAYALKVSLGGLPSNLLMLWIFLLWLIFAGWIVRAKQLENFWLSIKNLPRNIRYLTGLFLLSGTVSLAVGGFSQKTLGEFLVIFIQPLSLFFIGRYIFSSNEKFKIWFLQTSYFLLAVLGAYAVIQYFSGIGLPLLFQGNDFEPRRGVSIFLHPNFFALFAAPLLAFLLPDVGKRVQNWKFEVVPTLLVRDSGRSVGGNYKFIMAWILGAAGLLLSLSRAGWLGLCAAVLVYLFLAADKKIRTAAFVAGIIIFITIIFIPSTRHRLFSPLYGEKSAGSRITLWQSGIKAVSKSPIFGLGLGGYAKDYRQLITDQSLPDHNFPHNIFLDLWVETGLLGLISLTGLIGLIIYQGLYNRKNLFKLSVALFLTALIVQGQIDNPYFKNDLSALFWLIISLI